jgi:hypothetical protein
MRQRAFEWDPRPPNIRERIISGIWLAVFVLAVANYYAEWRLFPGYDKWVLGGLFLAGLLLFARMPDVRRVEGVKRPLAYWLIVCLGLIGGIVLWGLAPRG